MAAAMVVALAVGMEPARVAFPGSNGDIAYDSTIQVFLMNSDGENTAFVSNRDGDNDIYKNYNIFDAA